MQGFLVIDKPSGWTSHDVVAKMRGILGIKKIGHLGTLDPMATGVLVLAVGKEYTKQVQDYMGCDKEYAVEMELGKISDTYDIDGQVEKTGLVIPNPEEIKAIMEKFWGRTLQVPPAFSAKKIKGQRAYKMARAGKEVKLEPREVEMQGRDIQVNKNIVQFVVTVSSGTYVRSLVHDIGQALSCGAVMSGLRRTRVGNWQIGEATSIEELEKRKEAL